MCIVIAAMVDYDTDTAEGFSNRLGGLDVERHILVAALRACEAAAPYLPDKAAPSPRQCRRLAHQECRYQVPASWLLSGRCWGLHCPIAQRPLWWPRSPANRSGWVPCPELGSVRSRSPPSPCEFRVAS